MNRKQNPNPESLMLIAGAAALAYWWWKGQAPAATSSTPPASTTSVISTAPSTAPVTTAPVQTTPPVTSTPPATVTTPAGCNPDNIGTCILNAAVAAGLDPSGRYSPDQWDYFARQTISGFTPPSPETLFPDQANIASTTNPGLNASHDPVNFLVYWGAVAPFVPRSGALSGLGASSFFRHGIHPYGGWRGRGWAA